MSMVTVFSLSIMDYGMSVITVLSHSIMEYGMPMIIVIEFPNCNPSYL